MTPLRDYTIHMIGHGHIDPTWLWRWTEGYEEVRATFRSALDRMNETPGFKFTASSACFYAWVKEVDPEMFEEIRQRVKEGRWDLVGGWWIEPDCNIPGGESFVRHGLYSQRFFTREFGIRATVGFNPDSFGHAGTLPQIYSKMGIHYYVYMRPEPYREMRYPRGTTFWWRANDGSQILACNLPESYNSDHRDVLDRVARLPRHPFLNPGQTHILGFYGVGNHGGGPTRLTIQKLLDSQNDETLPRVRFSTLMEYFDDFLATTDRDSIPVIDTDLQHHARGCYSVHAEVKRLNRRAEHALMTAERFATLLWLLEGRPYPGASIEAAWKDVLYNQFHDILAGTSIQSSYEDTRDQMGGAIHTAHRILNESLQRLARAVDTSPEGNTVMVFNPLPWPVKQAVTAPPITERELEQPIHMVDDAGRVVPSQPVLGERVGHTAYAFTADVPAFGYRCYHARSGAKAAEVRGTLEAGRDFLENYAWRIEFDPYAGHMSRLYDKKHGVEVLRKGNVLAALVDQSDTWSHDYAEWRVEAGRFGQAALELLELGDVRATVRVMSRFRQSTAEQFITLYRETDDIDCAFRINWQEQYTMLKLAYETAISPGVATYDTAYGAQIRNTNGSEEPGQKWFDLTGTAEGKRYGLAVLNDSRYGFDVRDGIMRVTLLRSPAYAHHDPTRFRADEPYPIMDQGWHTVKIRLVPHVGPWQEAAVPRRAWQLNEPLMVHVESGHPGALPAQASFLATDADNVLLSVLKKSEDGDDLVIRGYETAGRPADATIRLPQLGMSFTATFAPHEIKTLRFNRQTGTATEVNLLEE
jgi:alpha-mannosidase